MSEIPADIEPEENPLPEFIIPRKELERIQAREHALAVKAFSESYMLNASSRKVERTLKGIRCVPDGLRGLLVDGDLYWWDADLATHCDGIRWLFPDSRERFAGLLSMQYEIELHVSERDGSVYATVKDKALWPSLLAHPNFDPRWM